MRHAHHAASGGFDFLFLLGLLFLGGTLFYVFRLACPGYLRKVNGYFDPENEFWHGMCLLSMVSMTAPNLVPVFTATLWIRLLSSPVTGRGLRLTM